MRVISIDGMVDVPYDGYTFVAVKDSVGDGYKIYAKEGANEFLMAEYRDVSDVKKSFIDLRHANHKNYSNYTFRNPGTQVEAEA